MNDELIVRAKGGVVEVEANHAIAGGLLWNVVKKETDGGYVLQRKVRICPIHQNSATVYLTSTGELKPYCRICELEFLHHRKVATIQTRGI